MLIRVRGDEALLPNDLETGVDPAKGPGRDGSAVSRREKTQREHRGIEPAAAIIHGIVQVKGLVPSGRGAYRTGTVGAGGVERAIVSMNDIRSREAFASLPVKARPSSLTRRHNRTRGCEGMPRLPAPGFPEPNPMATSTERSCSEQRFSSEPPWSSPEMF